MANRTKKLQLATELFQFGDYIAALRQYSDVYNSDASVEEAKIGVFLSDMAMERSEEAKVLFDYYYMIKDEQEDASSLVSDIISALDSSTSTIAALIASTQSSSEDELDGISYDDFMRVVDEKGDFKEAFEDIMFSTRVFLTSKDELVGFISKLHNGGFRDMALQYLDETSEIFDYDQDVMKLYSMFEEQK